MTKGRDYRLPDDAVSSFKGSESARSVMGHYCMIQTLGGWPRSLRRLALAPFDAFYTADPHPFFDPFRGELADYFNLQDKGITDISKYINWTRLLANPVDYHEHLYDIVASVFSLDKTFWCMGVLQKHSNGVGRCER
jgi:hypothetical protein